MSPQEPCLFCEDMSRVSSTQMISQALYDRYSTSHNQRYLSTIQDIVQQQYTEDTARFRQYYVLDDQDEFLSRHYRLDEWNRKVTMLGDYYGHHRDVPLFFGLPVSMAYYKYHDKIKQYEYKLLKRSMGEEVESLSSVRDSEESRKGNGTQLIHVLKDLTQDKGVDESRAFNEVCGKLGDLIKYKGRRIKKLMGLPYHQKDGNEKDGFEIYLRQQTNKNNPKRRLSRKNMISGDKEHNVPLYAFRKLQKIKNTSNEGGYKGSMESTMSKKNVSNGNKNIQSQLQMYYGENKQVKPVSIQPTIRKIESINGLRFRTFDKKQSINQIYGLHTRNKTTTTHQALSKTSLVNFKKRVGNNISQSVFKGVQRPSSVNLKARSKSINNIRPVPSATERKTTPDRRYNPNRKLSIQSGTGTIVTTSCNLKRRPSPSRNKVNSQVSIQKFDSGLNEEGKQRVDKLLNQKLLLTGNTNTLYQRLKKGQ